MTTEFVLRIVVGNEGTLGDAAISDLVRTIADKVGQVGMHDNNSYCVRDQNGNLVGTYGRYNTEDAEESR